MPQSSSSLALLAFVLACSILTAGTGGSIAGTVSDPAGGVMKDVTVVARNTETGISQLSVTNESGFYAFALLPSGSYELQVDQPGFKPYLQKGLEMVSNAALRVDLTLTLGTHNETL